MKRRTTKILTVLCAAALSLNTWAAIVPTVHAAEPEFKQSGLASVAKMTKEEIASVLDGPKPSTVFDRAPHIAAPYDAGKISQEALDSGLARLNMVRQLAGLKAVTLDETYNDLCQHGAVVNSAIGKLEHHPERVGKPEDMSQEFFDRGCAGTSRSNLFMCYPNGNQDLLAYGVEICMNEPGDTNLPVMGHRRWQLNPTMGKVGFGFANKENEYGYGAIYSFDHSNWGGESSNYDFISWPSSGNFPNTLFEPEVAWSVSLNPKRYQWPQKSDLTVTIKQESDGTVWTLDGSRDYPVSFRGEYLNTDNGGYGEGSCIIFRPQTSEPYQGLYTVMIDGLKDNNGSPADLSYQVEFFHPDDLKPRVTVHYDFGEYEGLPDQVVIQGQKYMLPNAYGTPIPDEDHVLRGWDVNGETYEMLDIIYPMEDLVIKPIWHIHKWSLTDNGWNHCYTCECGKKKGYSDHVYDNAEWKHDEANHWQECVCGHKSNRYSHSLTIKSYTNPTCTEPGMRIKSCWRCGYEVEEEWAPAEGHKLTFVKEVPATCTEKGTVQHWTCAKCGENFADEKGETKLTDLVIPAIGHDYEAQITTKPSCTQEGIKTFTCRNCGDVYTETIPMTEHVFGSDWKQDATSHWHECACGEKSELTDHTFGEWTIIKEATESETGLQEHSCTVCGYKATEEIPMKEHEHVFGSEWKQDATSHWHECACGEKSELTGHTFGEWTIVKEATESETGLQEHSCTVCGYKATEEIPMKEHEHVFGSDWKQDETSHWHECACGEKSELAGHTFGEWTVIKEATESETGLQEHSCTICGYKATEEIPVKEHEHVFGSDWKQDETSHWHECACGEKSELSVHSFGEWTVIKEATESETGLQEHSCTICGYKATEEIPMKDHEHVFGSEWKQNETAHWHECACGEKLELSVHAFEEEIITPATCTAEGSKTLTCSVCGYQCTRPIPALGHRYEGGVTTKPTCTAEGLCTFTCANCGDQYTETIPAAGHHMVHHQAVEPGCLTSGNAEYWTCSECGKTFADAEGKNTLDEVTLPAQGHELVHQEAVVPTQEMNGCREHWHCERCNQNFADAAGTTLLEDVVIEFIPQEPEDQPEEPQEEANQEPANPQTEAPAPEQNTAVVQNGQLAAAETAPEKVQEKEMPTSQMEDEAAEEEQPEIKKDLPEEVESKPESAVQESEQPREEQQSAQAAAQNPEKHSGNTWWIWLLLVVIILVLVLIWVFNRRKDEE